MVSLEKLDYRIVRQAAESHGGRVELTAAPGGGLLASVRLPGAKRGAAAAE